MNREKPYQDSPPDVQRPLRLSGNRVALLCIASRAGRLLRPKRGLLSLSRDVNLILVNIRMQIFAHPPVDGVLEPFGIIHDVIFRD